MGSTIFLFFWLSEKSRSGLMAKRQRALMHPDVHCHAEDQHENADTAASRK
jgi:hypothetical protein